MEIENDFQSSIENVINTAHDAIRSKYCALQAGYFQDDKLSLMTQNHSYKQREPYLNRGSWLRIKFIQDTCQTFLNTFQNCQIINLGCGLDTLYYRLVFNKNQQFYDFDMQEIIQLKAKRLNFIHNKEYDYYYNEQNPNYIMIVQDLSDTFKKPEFIDQNLPTLFISDVFISYLLTDDTIKLFQSINSQFQDNQIVIFEPINPNDAFGQQMQYNLAERNIFMPTFSEIGFINTLGRILLRNTTVEIKSEQILLENSLVAYNNIKSEQIEKLELVDELEGFNQIMEHYCCILKCDNQQFYNKCKNMDIWKQQI